MGRTRVKDVEISKPDEGPAPTQQPTAAAPTQPSQDTFAGIFGGAPSAPKLPPTTQTIIGPLVAASEMLTGANQVLPRETVDDDIQKKTDEFVHGSSELTDIDPRFAPVSTILFDNEDWVAFSTEFDAWLELDGRPGNFEGHLRKAHEMGPKMLRRAQKIFLQVKRAREDWEAENDIVLGSMMEQARESLEDDKANKKFTGVITKDAVESRCAVLFQDEKTRQSARRREYKAIEARCAHDVEVAGTRCRNLDTQLNRLH